MVEKFELHDTLNNKFFDLETNKIKSKIKNVLISIANEFVSGVKEKDIPISVLDFYFLGSNASYNYLKDSDIDLHIIIDDCDDNVLNTLYDYMKTRFNEKHDITVKGCPVEVYVQCINEPNASNGVYSLLTDEWIKEPQPIELSDEEKKNLNIEETDLYKEWFKRFTEVKRDVQEINQFLDDLRTLRQQSLRSEGEFGVGNLIFKQFRNDGKIKTLRDLRDELKSEELSLECLNEGLFDVAAGGLITAIMHAIVTKKPNTREMKQAVVDLDKETDGKYKLTKLYDDSVLELKDLKKLAKMLKGRHKDPEKIAEFLSKFIKNVQQEDSNSTNPNINNDIINDSGVTEAWKGEYTMSHLDSLLKDYDDEEWDELLDFCCKIGIDTKKELLYFLNVQCADGRDLLQELRNFSKELGDDFKVKVPQDNPHYDGVDVKLSDLGESYLTEQDNDQGTFDLEYDDITVTVYGDYHDTNYYEEPYYDEDEREIHWTYTITKDELIECLYELLEGTFAGTDEEFGAFLQSDYERLFDEKNDEILNYFRDRATEDAQENNSEEYLPEPDYESDDWIDEEYDLAHKDDNTLLFEYKKNKSKKKKKKRKTKPTMGWWAYLNGYKKHQHDDEDDKDSGVTINPDAGDVELGIDIFNNMMGSDSGDIGADVGDAGGDGGSMGGE